MQTFNSHSTLMSCSVAELLAQYNGLAQQLSVTDPDTPEYQTILGAMANIKRAIFTKRRMAPRPPGF